MKCVDCNGEVELIKDEHEFKCYGKVIIIKNIPTLKCVICLEKYYSADVLDKIENILEIIEKATRADSEGVK